MEYLLSTNGLTKQYGEQKALNSVDIHVRKGEIYGLIGRNGAGKTTLLKIISGLSSPTKGTFSIFGKSGREISREFGRVGTLIESPGVYPDMSAYENIKLKCIAMGVRKKNVVEELLGTVGLKDAGKKAVKNFSVGMKQRLGIALALVGDVDLVVLDEPINGLDPQGIVEVRETIEKLNKDKGITFIISSHILEELSKMATSYGIIHHGELVQELSREELSAKCSERLELKTTDVSKACVVLEKMGIRNLKVVDKNSVYIYERLDEVSAIVRELVHGDVDVLGISVLNENLEDYFLGLTGGAQNA